MIHRLLLFVLLAALAAAGYSGPRSRGDSGRPSPDGEWSGTLSIHNQAAEKLELRLSIKGQRARVWTVHEENWIEVKPGGFRVQRHHSNVLLYSMSSGEDDDGTWVESWVLVVTPITADTLKVAWSRLVNNMDLEDEPSKFAEQALGTIQRIRGDSI